MRRCEIPTVVASLVGLGLLARLGVSAAHADFTFGEPVDQTTVIPVLDPLYENPFCLTADGLEMYGLSFRPEAIGGCDIWVSQRDSIDAAWPAPEHLGPAVNEPNGAYSPCLSPDGLTLYFSAKRADGYGDNDLYVATRASRKDPWNKAVNLGEKVNSPSFEGFPCLSPDGLELYFQSTRPGGLGGFDIYVSRRAMPDDPWGDPQNLGPVVNSEFDDVGLCLSADGRLLVFQDLGGATPRPGGYGNGDMWMTTRASLSASWGPPVNLGPNVNGPEFATFPRLTPDGSWLYYSTANDDWSVWDNWQTPIVPSVDFNADGKADLTDLRLLIDNWGTGNTLYDIGPYAWGDGKVDIEDLKAFVAEWEKPRAANALPEFTPTEGSPEGVAVDKAGNVYISVSAVSDQVWKFSPAGVKSILADLGEPGGGALGMTTDAAGNVYVCRASVTSAGVLLPSHGVYRIAPNGEVSLLPGTDQIVLANALAFDEQETLYITEMFSGDFATASFGPGGVWRITKGGTAEVWIRDELLTGFAPSLFPYPVGANGIASYGGALYVANPDKALIVRVAVRPDGSAGQPEIWKAIEDVPESLLYGSPAFPVMIDGLAFDENGNAYVTVISRNAIVQIDADDQSQRTVASHPQVPLDAPANVAFGTDQSGDAVLFITNLGMCGALIPDLPWPGPGLVKIRLQDVQRSD